MGWKLELVETCPASGARRMEVAWLGEVVAPASVDGIGLDHGMTPRLLGDLQHAVVAPQEAALQAEADLRRRPDRPEERRVRDGCVSSCALRGWPSHIKQKKIQ